MNSFIYFVLHLIITTYQAQCKRPQKTGEEAFRRPFNQINLMSSAPEQRTTSRFIELANKTEVNYEVFKNKKNREAEVKLTKLPVNGEQDGQTINTVLVMGKQGKHFKGKPKEFNEAKKKAIKERFFQKEKMDVLDIERKKVEEMKQNVARLRKGIRAERSKKKNHNTMKYNGEAPLVLRSNLVDDAWNQKTTKFTPTKKTKSLFTAETKTGKENSASGSSSKKKKYLDSSSDSDDDPVMRGLDKEDDVDEDLYFDLDEEFLSHVI